MTATAAEAARTRPAGVSAAARVVAAPDGRGGTALPVLHGDGPLAVRRTRSETPGEARVMLVGAMSGPLGGDRLALRADVATGARLAVGSAAATLSLPGHRGGPATYDLRLTVADGAGLRWLPEPLIATAGSALEMSTRVRLEGGARLVLREEQVLGRAGEEPGDLVGRLDVTLDGRPLLVQELAFGPGAPHGAGPAVLDGHRAVGQLLVVDPAYRDRPCPARRLAGDPSAGQAVLTPLAGPAALVTAVAADALRLRRLLEAGHRAARCAGP